MLQTGQEDKRVAEPAGQPGMLLNDAAKLAWLKWSHGIRTRFDIKQMDVNKVSGAVGNSFLFPLSDKICHDFVERK